MIYSHIGRTAVCYIRVLPFLAHPKEAGPALEPSRKCQQLSRHNLTHDPWLKETIANYVLQVLRSTVHRVAFSSETAAEGESSTDPRYSVVFFCHPADDTPLEPVPSERVASFRGSDGEHSSQDQEDINPYAQRKVLTAAEHLQMRLRATYLQMYGDEGKK